MSICDILKGNVVKNSWFSGEFSVKICTLKLQKFWINVNTQWSYPLYANILDSLNVKNEISLTPLNWDLNALTFALNDSAAALVVLFTK